MEQTRQQAEEALSKTFEERPTTGEPAPNLEPSDPLFKRIATERYYLWSRDRGEEETDRQYAREAKIRREAGSLPSNFDSQHKEALEETMVERSAEGRCAVARK